MLADARHDGPVPPEVAARLDEVLAGLHDDADPAADVSAPETDAADEPTAEPQRPATVVPLRRRAARLSRYVLAAAAVLVIGYGTTQVIGNTDGIETATAPAPARRRQQRRERGRLRRRTLRGGGRPAAQRAPGPRHQGPRAARAGHASTQDLHALGSTAEKDATALRSARRLSGACGPRTRPVPRLAHPRGGVRRSSDAGRLPPARGRQPAGGSLPLRLGEARGSRSVR